MSKIKNCAGKESFERMNYLYQISNITLSEGQGNTAAALYSNLLINISKKSVQRLEPDIKRSVCKKCHTLLIADVTAKVRIRNKRIRFNCKKCQSTKVLKAVPNYLPWVQNPKAVMEKLEY